MPDIAMPGAPAIVLPAARHPLDGIRLIDEPGRISAAVPAPASRLLLRGDAAVLSDAFGIGLPREACRAESDRSRHALWLGPDEWLLIAPAGELDGAAALAGGCAVDVSHRQAALVLQGPLVTDTLASGCPLDLHPKAFPVGMCTRTVFGKAEIVLWRREAELFHIEVWRSFAAYVHERLRVAVL